VIDCRIDVSNHQRKVQVRLILNKSHHFSGNQNSELTNEVEFKIVAGNNFTLKTNVKLLI
jgi:hypothetical protein